VSALVGYICGALVVLPFDRVKAVMQAAALDGRPPTAVAAATVILRNQGLKGLYQGFQPHLMIAPYTVLYYSLYDELLGRGGSHQLAPLGAAVCARTVETIVRMPVELLRTQMQASEGSVSFLQCLRAQWSQPASSWLRGTVPTLLRDVPFSGVYWLTYEKTKTSLQMPDQLHPGLRTLVQSFCSGAGAGMVAALVTMPADVVKTFRQYQVEAGKTPTYGDLFRHLVQSPRVAFAGVAPRMIRVPAGLATMMSTLELTRWAFEMRRERARGNPAE